MSSDYNSLENDIRLNKIPLDVAEKSIKSFENSWIYIKSTIAFDKNDYLSEDFMGQYYKFKVRNVKICDFIYIYGYEDNDRLLINKSQIIQSENSVEKDEIKLVIRNNNITSEIFIKKYSPRVDSRIEDILHSKNNLIITEGKTDWKHLKRALGLLKEQGRFAELDIDFLEYEDIEMGNKTLKKVCEYNALFSSEYLKIFIFDSDDTKINNEHKNESFLSYGNNVYSIVLPIPEHRKTTPMISIEHYYTDDEIKTFDRNQRRLFFANEFNFNTGQHNLYKTTYALNVNPQVANNLIIDEKVYSLKYPVDKKEDVYKDKGKVSVALSKNDFAENIYQRVPPFDKFSIESFSCFFDKIVEIYNDHKSLKSDNAMEISRGVYHEHLESGFQELTLNCSVNNETAMMLQPNVPLVFLMGLSETMEQIILTVTDCIGNLILNFPIDISDTLLNFLIAKSKNCFNRMYLFVCDENRTSISKKEILHSNDANVIIDRILIELNITMG